MTPAPLPTREGALAVHLALTSLLATWEPARGAGSSGMGGLGLGPAFWDCPRC